MPSGPTKVGAGEILVWGLGRGVPGAFGILGSLKGLLQDDLRLDTRGLAAHCSFLGQQLRASFDIALVRGLRHTCGRYPLVGNYDTNLSTALEK